ncbi:MAG: hypothetical protein ACFB22_07225 [Rhodothalassiaceae bacterium]
MHTDMTVSLAADTACRRLRRAGRRTRRTGYRGTCATPILFAA